MASAWRGTTVHNELDPAPNRRLLPTRPRRFGRRDVLLVEECGGLTRPHQASPQKRRALGGLREEPVDANASAGARHDSHM